MTGKKIARLTTKSPNNNRGIRYTGSIENGHGDRRMKVNGSTTLVNRN